MNRPPKIDRKTLKGPDEFQTKGSKILEFLVSQRSRFLPVLVVAGVAMVAVYGYDWWTQRETRKAWEAYVETSKTPEAERWEKLKAFHDKFKGTRPELFAASELGDHYFDEAKKKLLTDPNKVDATAVAADADQASQWYTKALAYKDLLPKEKQLLLMNRAATSELKKDYDKAIEDYRQAADIVAEAKPLAQLGVGKIHELRGETAKALEFYEKVAVESQANEFGKMAKNSIRRLKSPLFHDPKGKGNS